MPWQTTHALYGALSQACRLFPDFRTLTVDRAMARVLARPIQRFIDRWVLPEPGAVRRATRPRRGLQLWRKFWLMDTYGRRLAFATYHVRALWRGWRPAK